MPFWQSPLDNWVLLGSFIGGTLICVVLLYVPYLSTKHKGGAWEWAMVAVMVVVFMMICEFYKLVKRTFLMAWEFIISYRHYQRQLGATQ
jgi:small-conductance mechanosensitive channel